MAIVEFLEKDTYKLRFKKLASELKNNGLSIEVITKEVEIVRKKRHNQPKVN